MFLGVGVCIHGSRHYPGWTRLNRNPIHISEKKRRKNFANQDKILFKDFVTRYKNYFHPQQEKQKNSTRSIYAAERCQILLSIDFRKLLSVNWMVE